MIELTDTIVEELASGQFLFFVYLSIGQMSLTSYTSGSYMSSVDVVITIKNI
jgi:hypothetical protein